MQVSAKNYSIFRFAFGLLMINQIVDLVPHIHDLSKSTFVFHYPYLSFIEAWSHELIDVLQLISIAAALLLSLGIIPRIAAFIFMLSFGYLFLIEMSYYNNHYYLWCLIGFLFAISDTHHSISIIDILNKKFEKNIHILNYIALGLLFSIVYFYATIAKINSDWLQGYPMRLLAAARNYPYPDITGLLMSYGGLLFDGSVTFILWRKPKAWYVIIPYLGFHLTNFFVFNIGIFPFAMLAAWFIYLTLSAVEWVQIKAAVMSVFSKKNIKNATLILFFTFQILFPLRCYLLVRGNIAWNRQGHYFAWRMMLHNHEPKYFQYLVEFPNQPDKNYVINFQKLVTPRQWHNTYNDPYFIWLLAQKLKKDAVAKYKTNDVKVFANSVIQLNQHHEQPLIDTSIDLSAVKYNIIGKNSFINSFQN